MDNQEKLNSVVKVAQTYILFLLKDYISTEELLKIDNMFKKFPVVIEQINPQSNEFGSNTQVGGVASNDKIVIGLDDVDKVNINIETEFNNLLGVIIHEYAHKIRSINNPYGEMLEESFATIFAEVCVNNGRLIFGDKKEEKQPFEMLTSVNYQKYESQIRGLLYVLKQNNLDIKLIVEYITGKDEKFKQDCVQVFGNEFNNYFESISSKNNQNSEQLITSIITKYINQNGLNISDYWKNNNKLTKDSLYFRGSSTLSKAVVNSGIDSFSNDDKEFYKYYESTLKLSNENDNLINQEKVDRIKNFIDDNFSLKNKTKEDIYDSIIDLCSTYIQHQNKEDEESKLFISEIKKLIPNIEKFKSKFVDLRISGQDKNIFDNLDLNNITYQDIERNMNKLLNINEIDNELGGVIK